MCCGVSGVVWCVVAGWLSLDAHNQAFATLTTSIIYPSTRQIDGQVARQARKQAGRQENRQAGKQASKQADRQPGRKRGKQASRQSGKEIKKLLQIT